MIKNCLLCGVGGQGVVLASKLIAAAVMEKGYAVRTSETIGMSQRGGSVVSHVRYGESIASPLIPEGSADVIIAFEPAEAVRAIKYLKQNGTVIVNKKAVKPTTANLNEDDYKPELMLDYLIKNVKNLYIIDGEDIEKKLETAKTLNVVMLGVLAKTNCLDIDIANLKEALKNNVNQKFWDVNEKALMLGNDLYS